MAVLPHTSARAAGALAERIRGLIPTMALPGVGAVTISVGVAQLEPDDNLESLFRRVDRALYRAKDQGRDQVVVDGAPPPQAGSTSSSSATRAAS